MKWGGNMGAFHIAILNIKKRKNEVASFGILIIIAALLMNIGLNLSLKVCTFYDEKVKEYNVPHYFAIINNNDYKQNYLDFFENDRRVKETELEEVIYMGNATFLYGDSEIDYGLEFINGDNEGNMLPLRIIEKAEVPLDEAIYLPISLKNAGCDLEGGYSITYKNKEYIFKIAGFFEAPVMGNLSCGALKYYLSNEAYKKLYKEIGGSKSISIILNHEKDALNIQNDFKKQTDVNIGTIGDLGDSYDLNIVDAKGTSTMMPIMAGSIIILFSILIEVVVLIVIKFRVENDINNSMANIGALEAVGYTSKQIITSITLEYLLVAAGAAILGIIVSYVIMPSISGILTELMGMIWTTTFSFVYSAFSIIFIISLIVIMTLIVSRKIKKLPPVVALRGGIVTHNFNSNKFPLESKFGDLHLKLGLKYIFTNLKQSIMICIIIAGITMACIASIILYSNFSKDNEMLYKMAGFETADLSLTLTKHTDFNEMINELETMDEIRKAAVGQTTTITIEDRSILTFISDDCSKFEMMDFYEGQYPEHDNEIVITGLFADTINKKVGDEIEVYMNGVSNKYIITGLTQGMNNGGKTAVITLDGIRRLSQFYDINSVNVYLNEDVNIDEFSNKIINIYGRSAKQNNENDESYNRIKKAVEERVSNLLTMYGVDSVQYSVMVGDNILISGNSGIHKVDKIGNLQKLMVAQISTFTTVFGVLTQVIVVVTLIIVAMILYLVIKAMIIKRRKEFATYKSIGYKNNQIMKQIALGLIPVITLGVIAGLVLGCTLIPKILAKCFYYAGASHVILKLNMLYIIPLCIVIIVFSYFISMFIARKIKNISVYELFTE